MVKCAESGGRQKGSIRGVTGPSEAVEGSGKNGLVEDKMDGWSRNRRKEEQLNKGSGERDEWMDGCGI